MDSCLDRRNACLLQSYCFVKASLAVYLCIIFIVNSLVCLKSLCMLSGHCSSGVLKHFLTSMYNCLIFAIVDVSENITLLIEMYHMWLSYFGGGSCTTGMPAG